MLVKKDYTVTKLADVNTLIAGKRRKVGETLQLTAKEAEWEEKRGLIAPAVDKAAEDRPKAKADR